MSLSGMLLTSSWNGYCFPDTSVTMRRFVSTPTTREQQRTVSKPVASPLTRSSIPLALG